REVAAGENADRRLTGTVVKSVDQGLGLRIGFGIEPLLRMAVAAEKAFEPKHVAIVGAPDDDRPARAGFEQSYTAENQGAHDPFAELRFRNQERPQPVGRDNQRIDLVLRVSV